MELVHIAATGRPASPHAPSTGSVITIGAYDGVHLGHRALIDTVRAEAERLGARSVVVTFDRHPAQVVRPASAPLLLTDLDQKLELLATTGVDATAVVHFDEERAGEEPEQFVRSVLVQELGARLVIVGEDFHFGHRRRGNVALLTELGTELGFSVVGHQLVGVDGRAARDDLQVSSTAIRRALTEGRVEAATAMLGRAHEMRGPVVRDRQVATELLGMPTANVAIGPEMLMPATGIYAGHLVRSDGEVLPAAVYVGGRPTFFEDRAAVVLEAHVLDWTGDLYGEHVGVRFVHRIRPDQRFEGVEALAAQMRSDCDEARRLLGVV